MKNQVGTIAAGSEGYRKMSRSTRTRAEKKPGADKTVFPVSFVLLLLGAFVAVMGLPIVFGAQAGALDLAAAPSGAVEDGRIILTPAEGWTIQSVLPQEDSALSVERANGAVSVSLAELPLGETETLQLLCQGEDGRETQVSYSFLLDGAETLTVRAYPEEAELYRVSYLYEYAANA